MKSSSNGREDDCLAILQLQKWNSPEIKKLNFSQFRQGFISPRRELLLLLSYQSQALLLPLRCGDCVTSKDELENSRESNFASNLRDDVSSITTTSSSGRGTGNIAEPDGFTRSNVTRCDDFFHYVSDVHSLAWGVCGDKYDQHDNAPFREFLFVSGDRGVTVHVFLYPDKSSQLNKPIHDGIFEEGAWVEWGPSATLAHPSQPLHDLSIDVDRMEQDKEKNHEPRGDDGLIGDSTSKRWLTTFLTKVETREHDGNICTSFPDNQSLPSSATIVSFSIFDNNSQLSNLVSPERSLSSNERVSNPLSGVSPSSNLSSSSLQSTPDALSNFLEAETDGAYKCFKVFSSNSHLFIGFILTFLDSDASHCSDLTDRSLTRFIVVVARLDDRGIQWLCTVKLKGSLDLNFEFGWTDFQFMGDLLLCLRASGSIFIYCAVTGKYVTNLDVLKICECEPYPTPNLPEAEKLHSEDEVNLEIPGINVTGIDKCNVRSNHETNDYGKIIFKRLIVGSSSSLITTIDEHGIVYALSAVKHIPRKHYSDRKLFLCENTGHGIVGWDVCGLDISQQRLCSKLPGSYYSFFSSIKEGCFPSDAYIRSNQKRAWNLQDNRTRYDMRLGDFSVPCEKTQPGTDLPSYFARKVFLPMHGFSDNVIVCCSPLGITRFVKKKSVVGGRSFKIVHSRLHLNFTIQDDRCLNSCYDLYGHFGIEDSSNEEAVGCVFQERFYLVTESGLSVVLPSVSVPSNFYPVESIGYKQLRAGSYTRHQGGDIIKMEERKQNWSPWKVEVLDRVLMFEKPGEADRVCMENGWDLKVSRMRRLQLALEYLRFDEIEQSLEMVVVIDLGEEGILRLLLAATYLMLPTVGNESEISAASRLLALASCFATRMIRNYGLARHKKDAFTLQTMKGSGVILYPFSVKNKSNHTSISIKLRQITDFLVIIRNLQSRLSLKFRRPGQVLEEGAKALILRDSIAPQDDYELRSSDALPLEANQEILSLRASSFGFDNTLKDDISPITLMHKGVLHGDFNEVSALVPQEVLEKKFRPSENPKDMMQRWEIDNMDLKTIVRDALLSDRLPLAVLQLHLHRLKDMAANKEPHDTFTEVHNVGRAIAYDLLLKRETGLAVATLRRLGEDIEVCLKQLVFGTVRKSLRLQVANEMTRYGYLGPHELNLLGRISLIETLYPSSSFWRAFIARQRELTKDSSTVNKPQNLNLSISNFKLRESISVECGEVDGAVLGLWIDIKANSDVPVDDNESNGAYWVAAPVWSDAWNERTFDRIELDQPSVSGLNLVWDSQLEYYICHNNWGEVINLLNMIPMSVLSDGRLQISLDGFQTATPIRIGRESPDYGSYISSVQELDPVFMDVPSIKVFKYPRNSVSVWLQLLLEQKLAKKRIFLREYWDGTEDIMPLLAHSGFITERYRNSFVIQVIEMLSFQNSSFDDGEFQDDTVCALHKLVAHHCAQYNLPNLLDIYIDNKVSITDNDSLFPLIEATGDCQWAKWLISSRVKGREYDASFWNSRSIMSKNSFHFNNGNVLEIDEIILTVDDIAEGGGEMAALATLMYAPILIQNCLSSGSVNRHQNYSVQCTLENLRPILQKFSTLGRTLVASCFGQDTSCNFLPPKVKHVIGNSALSDYLNWRDNIFFSSGGDTSLLQMLPSWFPKAIRRLVQLYVQGPLGWQSLAGLPLEESYLNHNNGFVIKGNEHTEVSAVYWEAAIQKRVEEELYDSSLKVTGPGIEHHLHRGRPLAAFTHILNTRAQMMKLEYSSKGESTASTSGQTNVQSDVQGLLAALSMSEVSLISSVIPLAIMHFEDSMLVASCAFLLELCGLSASMLRVDIAALRRIHAFYKFADAQPSPTGHAFHMVSSEGDIANSLAQALADDYLHSDGTNSIVQKGSSNSVTGKQPSRALMLVLQHLEKASLPLKIEEKTCGSWLSSGSGDGIELRSKQKETSHHWTLLTTFCQMHNIPLSTKYLAVLAKDNDWVGFLSEAQIEGYPFDVVIQTASKDFKDVRLKTHILTVLKGMQSRKKATSSPNSEAPDKQNQPSFSDETLLVPVELFGILAECENKKNPGESLLIKAKDMCWSVLALIASCFSDVSSLSCLTVWLEITAARETSSIKVNDISSQIKTNVGAAVEATNLLPSWSRVVTLHYNWRNPKRRRLMEPIQIEPMNSFPPYARSTSGVMRSANAAVSEEGGNSVGDHSKDLNDSDEGPDSLSKMVAVLCEQHLFLPLLRAFEMFLPSCCLLPFIRALQAYSQMRLSEASAHLGSFSSRIKEEPVHLNTGGEVHIGISWISSTAVKAADAMLSTCPSPYEKRCLLQLLATTDFGDGGTAAAYYRTLYWKIDLAEPALRKDIGLNLGTETLDDGSLLTALEKNGHWAQARNWARQLETSGGQWKSAAHHVTETQAESMVTEWKEFLWDVPEERVALWGHCQMLFLRYSFPALQAGMFFLKHAEAVEKDIPARELHDLLLLSLQWLSGMITQSNPVYPLHLLREVETRVWLLAVESEAQLKNEGDFGTIGSRRDIVGGNTSSIIDRTAIEITKMDTHINAMTTRTVEKNDSRESNHAYHQKYSQVVENSGPTSVVGNTKAKRRAKGYLPSRRFMMDSVEKSTAPDDNYSHLHTRSDLHPQDYNFKIESSFSKWEERVGPAELERAVLSLLEFGQITAAKQLQNKLSPNNVPSEFKLVDVVLKLAGLSSHSEMSVAILDEETKSIMRTYNMLADQSMFSPLQVLESFATNFIKGSDNGLCKRILAVLKAANLLGLSFSEAFDKQPIELLHLLSLKAQESFEEAKLIIQTHFMPAAGIAQILAESFLKGLLAAHRGGYMDSQKEEGPAPLLWRFSDFMKWAELCPCEPEIGHALMRLVITGQEIPHACEVELLILSHHFYKSSACLDGVDVLVALAATRVEAYVSEGDFPCLARLITGVGNFYALNFILGILIENGQLNLLLQKYSAAAETNSGTAETVKGFRMAVLTSLKHFNPNDLDAFAMVYNHFDMKDETASLLESRARQASQQWFLRYDKDQNEDLLQSMRFYVEAAEVYSSVDAGNKTCRACFQASLVSLQIRMPDFQWIGLSETNARRALVEQSCFQEALIVAEAYSLNQPSEWALVLWNQMLKPELTEEFVAEFVAVLPLQPSMLNDLSKFYRAELAARGDQSQFSVWLTGGGLPGDWAKYLGRSFRCLLKRTRDLRLRIQLAAHATGFSDVIDACSKALDKVPDNAGPLVLRKGHGGGYLPLM